jgi:hypothetical protein
LEIINSQPETTNGIMSMRKNALFIVSNLSSQMVWFRDIVADVLQSPSLLTLNDLRSMITNDNSRLKMFPEIIRDDHLLYYIEEFVDA